MTAKFHLTGQLLATLVQFATVFTTILPPKYRPFVSTGVTVAQVLMGFIAQYTNPDGTPASVAYIKPQQ